MSAIGQELAKERIRTILQTQLNQATTILDLMEQGKVTTHEDVSGRNVDTTEQSIAKRKVDIKELNEAIERLDSLALVLGAEVTR